MTLTARREEVLETPRALFEQALDRHGAALQRLAAGYEADPGLREDLVQEIHLQIWRSLEHFDGRCQLKTWVYRVAHNTAVDHIAARRRLRDMVGLDSVDEVLLADPVPSPEERADRHLLLEAVTDLVRRLRPLDRQVMLLYLEGEDARTTAEVSGLTPGAVATRVHRFKALLARHFGMAEDR
ncbi:MAG: sigma-70 family RNA polymerase sigma factor [Azospirillaceae bacterium]